VCARVCVCVCVCVCAQACNYTCVCFCRHACLCSLHINPQCWRACMPAHLLLRVIDFATHQHPARALLHVISHAVRRCPTRPQVMRAARKRFHGDTEWFLDRRRWVGASGRKHQLTSRGVSGSRRGPRRRSQQSAFPLHVSFLQLEVSQPMLCRIGQARSRAAPQHPGHVCPTNPSKTPPPPPSPLTSKHTHTHTCARHAAPQ
jgi:hypothetical protein